MPASLQASSTSIKQILLSFITRTPCNTRRRFGSGGSALNLFASDLSSGNDTSIGIFTGVEIMFVSPEKYYNKTNHFVSKNHQNTVSRIETFNIKFLLDFLFEKSNFFRLSMYQHNISRLAILNQLHYACNKNSVNAKRLANKFCIHIIIRSWRNT